MIGQFLSDSSVQRKIAVAIAALLALFSNKLPFLANVSPDMIALAIGTIATWILQSGIKAAVVAHADGRVEAAKIAGASLAADVFRQVDIAPAIPAPKPTV